MGHTLDKFDKHLPRADIPGECVWRTRIPFRLSKNSSETTPKPDHPAWFLYADRQHQIGVSVNQPV